MEVALRPSMIPVRLPKRFPLRPRPHYQLPISVFSPFIVSANVRGKFDPSRVYAGPGNGVAGNIVIGILDADPSRPATVVDQSGAAHILSRPRHIIAALGPRDASTGVSATLPPGGLEVRDGVIAHWVAGESGVVGCLESAPGSGMIAHTEDGKARCFRLAGLLHDRRGRKLHIRDFAVSPSLRSFTRPLVLVGATSTEAGKTTLMGKLIRLLADQGLRVGAVKLSGTGGVLDSSRHRANGAELVHDFVDAGLITTHGEAAEVTARLPLILRRMEEAAVDRVMAELGGDLVSANNPAILDLPEVRENSALVIIIANDAMGALGVKRFNQTSLHYPEDRFRYFTSPFRNHSGMSRRMAALGITEALDPNSASDLERLAAEIITDGTGGTAAPRSATA